MCDYRYQGRMAFIFGLGLTISCFCPERFIILIVAAIVIILAIALMKC